MTLRPSPSPGLHQHNIYTLSNEFADDAQGIHILLSNNMGFTGDSEVSSDRFLRITTHVHTSTHWPTASILNRNQTTE